MTFTIPVWLLWTAGVVIGVPVTLFALLGSLFLIAYLRVK